MRLLIIEDEQELCLMICKVLKSKGYSVDYSFNGEENGTIRSRKLWPCNPWP